MAPESQRAKLYLLRDRLRGLQDMLRERFQAARATGVQADVRALSATIRKVKQDINTCLLTLNAKGKHNGQQEKEAEHRR
jgi:hypothetical protein